MKEQIVVKAEREYFHEIISKLRTGIYAIPVFQRNFVWRKEQVLDLFDSISKGYPIGTFLLWKPKDMAQKCSKDILTNECQETPQAEYYVLDGRQRLTSFYGCVLNDDNKDEIFQLSYNLERECFEYSRRPKAHIVKVSDLFDTFSLLDVLQNLKASYSPEVGRKYIDRARRMNATLQEYVVGEIFMENSNLNQAGTAFSRINSKGTDISKVSMLQAVSYQNEGDVLIADEIEMMIDGMSGYGFDTLSSDDILKCLYPYVGKSFYDDFSIDDFQKHDLVSCLDEMKSDLQNTVRFLHDDCYILSYKMLPYTRQLFTLVTFFKEHKNPTAEQKRELRKWLYFTTSQQLFQNSSLSLVREQFQRFRKYTDGEMQTPIDYETVCLEHPSSITFSIQSSLSNLIMISMINEYAKETDIAKLDYLGQAKWAKNNPAGVFLYLTHDDKQNLSDVQKGIIPNTTISRYLLDDSMVAEIRKGNIAEMCKKRSEAILRAETSLFVGVGLEVVLPSRG